MIPLGKGFFTNFPHMDHRLVTNLSDVYFVRNFFGLKKQQIFYIFVWRTKIFSLNNEKQQNLWESNQTTKSNLTHFNLMYPKPLVLIFSEGKETEHWRQMGS